MLKVNKGGRMSRGGRHDRQTREKGGILENRQRSWNKTEFIPFCGENNVKRKLKAGDPETECSVRNMKSGKRKRSKASNARDAKVLQQDREKTSVLSLFCAAVVKAQCIYASARGEGHSSAEWWHYSSLKTAVSTRMRERHTPEWLSTSCVYWFFNGIFPCVVQTNLILNRILSFHSFPLQLMFCQYLLPWNTDHIVKMLQCSTCQRQQ